MKPISIFQIAALIKKYQNKEFMKKLVYFLLLTFATSQHVLCMDQIEMPNQAARQARFQELLAQELTKIDKVRWPEIRATLPRDTSETFHKDAQFNNDLIALSHDPQADYVTWVRLMLGFKARIKRQALNTKKNGTKKKGAQKKDPTALLYDALAAQDATTVRALLVTHKGKINLNPQPTTPVTPPLHAAVHANSHGLCQALLDEGADPNIRWRMNIQDPWDTALFITPLNYALNKGFIERVVQLLNHKADPNIPNQGLPTAFVTYPLDQVCIKKNSLHTAEQTALIILLLKHKAHRARRTVLCARAEDAFGQPINLETEENLPWIIDHITHTESNNTFLVLHVDPSKNEQTPTKDKE